MAAPAPSATPSAHLATAPMRNDLGIAAFASAIRGVVIVFTGLNTLNNDLDHAASSAVPAVHTAKVVIQEDRLVHQDLFIGNS